MKKQIKGTTFIVNETFMNIKSLKEIVIEYLIHIRKGQSYDKSSL